MGEQNVQYMTQQGYDDMVNERVVLKDNKIPEIAKRIDDAKQLGDLSENAEYHAAKDDMAWAQGRLLELNVILENAEIIANDGNTETVNVGSTVLFTDQNNNEKQYTIVGAQEADPLNGRISNESPLGKSFLGSKKKDKISVETPAGVQEYTIVDIT